MARWLTKYWPEYLTIMWDDIEDGEKLSKIIPILVPAAESSVFYEIDFEPRDWIVRLKSDTETDAAFIIRRIEKTFANDIEREAIHDDINLNYQLLASKHTPDIYNSLCKNSPVIYQTVPLNHTRPALQTAITETRFRYRQLKPSEGKSLVDSARISMVTHERDLDSFSFGNQNDVTIIDFGDGHQLACIGIIPERRYLLHSAYGFLNFKNGIPIGYCQIITAFNFADVAFNLFPPFRGGESAFIFARNLAVTHKLFEVNTFCLDPYQLGYDNSEGLNAGVWWFYYKLGFRPTDKDVLKLLRNELKKMKGSTGYRTNIETLNILASANMYFDLYGKAINNDITNNIGNVTIGISDYLSSRFGSDREKGKKVCSFEAAERIDIRVNSKLNSNELYAWHRWSPLVLNLKRLDKWSTDDRRSLAMIIRCKGQPRELKYLHLLNKHRRLKNAIFNFASQVE